MSGPPPGAEDHADGYETWNQASQYVIELKLVYNLVTQILSLTKFETF